MSTRLSRSSAQSSSAAIVGLAGAATAQPPAPSPTSSSSWSTTSTTGWATSAAIRSRSRPTSIASRVAACASRTPTPRSRSATRRAPPSSPACGRRPPASTTTASTGARSFPSPRCSPPSSATPATGWAARGRCLTTCARAIGTSSSRARTGSSGARATPCTARCANDVADDAMMDHRNVSWVIEQLQAQRDQPFFLAAGLTKPHLPWNVPRKYYDRFPLESIELPPNQPNDLDDVPAGRRAAGSPTQAPRLQRERPRADPARRSAGSRPSRDTWPRSRSWMDSSGG